MSIWSPTYQQSVFKRHHTDKHFSEFLPTRRRQKSTGIDMEQNYVTVTLCVPIVQRFARSVGVKLLVSCYTVAAAQTQVPPTSPPPPRPVYPSSVWTSKDAYETSHRPLYYVDLACVQLAEVAGRRFIAVIPPNQLTARRSTAARIRYVLFSWRRRFTRPSPSRSSCNKGFCTSRVSRKKAEDKSRPLPGLLIDDILGSQKLTAGLW